MTLENFGIIAGISSNVKYDKRNHQSIDYIYQPSNPSSDNTSTKFIFAINNINFHDDNDEVTSLNKKRKRENFCNQNVDEKKGNGYEDKVKKKKLYFLLLKFKNNLNKKKYLKCKK